MRTINFVGLGALSMGIVGGCSSNPASGDVDAGHHVDAGDTVDSGTRKDTGTHLDGAASRDVVSKDSPIVKHDDAMAGSDVSTGDAKTMAEASGLDATSRMDTGEADAKVTGPERVLVTYGGTTSSELVAVNVANKTVDGRMQFASSGVTDARNTASPFLLEQGTDVVARLDVAKPWTIDSTWDMRLADGVDGGPWAAMPVRVVLATPTQSYVLRYERNALAVFDDSQTGDGGAPSSTVDLSSLVQAGDADGLVEMTAAAYVASLHRLYVVLGNVNETLAATYNGVICGATTSTVVAIDTMTNSIVNLGGTGPKGSITLTYFNPLTLVYDATGNRLIVVQMGCYAMPATVGTPLGTASRGGVEAVDLTTGKSTSLLALASSEFPMGYVDVPSGFAYIDATHAIIGFDASGQAVYSWNPTKTTLGDLIPNAPDVFTYDGNGNLVGARVDMSDAGVASTAIVSVSIANGASTTLAKNATTLMGESYVSSVDVWPHP